MNSSPKISVSIPAYNAASHLEECIQSVLSQEVDSMEVIVVDDCSTDATPDLVQSYSDPRLRYLRNDKNSGLSYTFSRCADEARGQFVSIFHADDVMLSGFLKEKIDLLEENPEISFVHSNGYRWDEGQGTSEPYWPELDQKTPATSGVDFISQVILGENPVIAPSVVFRKEIWEKVRPFSNVLSYAADMDMWVKFALHGAVAYLPKCLMNYRVHAGQDSKNFDAALKGFEEDFQAKSMMIASLEEKNEATASLQKTFKRTYCTRALNLAEKQLNESRVEEVKTLLRLAYRIDCGVVLSPQYIRLKAKTLLKRA